MKHRVFIAINLPEKIKQALVDYQKKWPELPIRWTKKDNLHITLEFLGYLTDEEVAKTCQETREMALKHTPFTINLNKICYGPPKKMPPRMIWAMGEKIPALNISPHITLGRIRTWQWRQIEPEERPVVDEDISLKFEVSSIEVMESILKKIGPDYTILESCPLKS